MADCLRYCLKIDKTFPKLARRLTAMANNTDDWVDAPAQPETEESVLAELAALDALVAADLRLNPRTLRRQLVRMLRTGEVVETALVARRLAAYHAAMECVR